MTIKIGFQTAAQQGSFATMLQRWREAEALGVDALYTSDHFFGQRPPPKFAANDGAYVPPAFDNGPNFEGTTIQAAMAMATTRPQIGCLVHAIGFRNPNLLADIARTIDHISNGRFILGLGSGYLQQDYEGYGYDWGTAKSRMEDLARAIPIIKSRFEQLNPPPLHKIPLFIAATGEKLGLRIVAEHADIWHIFGPLDKIASKIDSLKRICGEIGRDFSEIELSTWYIPHLMGNDQNPEDFVKLGIRNIVNIQQGPEWDLGLIRELISWRKSRSD